MVGLGDWYRGRIRLVLAGVEGLRARGVVVLGGAVIEGLRCRDRIASIEHDRLSRRNIVALILVGVLSC